MSRPRILRARIHPMRRLDAALERALAPLQRALDSVGTLRTDRTPVVAETVAIPPASVSAGDMTPVSARRHISLGGN